MLTFRPLLEGRFSGESPLWDDRRQCLYFVDMARPSVHCVKLDGTGHRQWQMPAIAGSLGLGESGRLIVAQPKAVLILDPDTGALAHLAAIPDEPGENRLNDGKVGPDGAFWVGSMDMRSERQKIGSLFRVTGRGEVQKVLANYMAVSNGLAWSPDGGTMYLSDSRGAWVDRFGFDSSTGAVGESSRFADLTEATGRPDGGACDALGRYWSAGVSAARLNVFSTRGRIETVIPTPVPAPSMPAFCGPDLNVLVVTSLLASPPRSDLDGAVILATAPVRGARIHRWRDM